MKHLLFAAVFLTSTLSLAKAEPIAEVPPITRNGVEYSLRTDHTECGTGKDCGMSVFVNSKTKSSGKMNWETKIYQKIFDPSLEMDVQEVSPRSMGFKGATQLRVIDERGTTYLITLKSGKMFSPSKTVIYPAK